MSRLWVCSILAVIPSERYGWLKTLNLGAEVPRPPPLGQSPAKPWAKIGTDVKLWKRYQEDDTHSVRLLLADGVFWKGARADGGRIRRAAKAQECAGHYVF